MGDYEKMTSVTSFCWLKEQQQWTHLWGKKITDTDIKNHMIHGDEGKLEDFHKNCSKCDRARLNFEYFES